MSARRTVLPTGSTPLELAVDRALPREQLGALTTQLADAVQAPPPAFLPWLAAEWSLAGFAPYFDSTEELIAHALPWLFERGSPAAVLRALRWLGFTSARLEEEGAHLHIDLGRILAGGELEHLARLVRASIPAHIYFYRVYWRYDLRQLRLDMGPGLDAGLLDNDSGIWLPAGDGGPVKVSLGRPHGGLAPPTGASAEQRAWSRRRLLRPTRDDDMTLDAWRLDSQVGIDSHRGRRRQRAMPGPLYQWPTRILGSARGRPHGTNAPLSGGGATALARLRKRGIASPKPFHDRQTWPHEPWPHRPWILVVPSRHSTTTDTTP